MVRFGSLLGELSLSFLSQDGSLNDAQLLLPLKESFDGMEVFAEAAARDILSLVNSISLDHQVYLKGDRWNVVRLVMAWRGLVSESGGLLIPVRNDEMFFLSEAMACLVIAGSRRW